MRTKALKDRNAASTLTRKTLIVLLCVGSGLIGGASSSRAETLEEVLVRAYRENPALNAQRTGAQATRENITRARTGYHPKVSATGDIGGYTETNRYSDGLGSSVSTAPRGVGVSLNQNLFDGFRTGNSVRQAESQTREADATVRIVEQNTLFAAVTAYMDVVADTAILHRIRISVGALNDQLRHSRARRGFGEVTKTDVAQVESRLASAKAQENVAEANLNTSVANFRQVTGAPPGQLRAAQSIDQLIPQSLDGLVALALQDNPAIYASSQGIESARLQADIIRGERLPTVSLAGQLARRQDVNYRKDEQDTASVIARISIPLYDGGDITARAAQAKHVERQRAFEASAVRDQVRAAAAAGWSQYQAAREKVGNQQIQLKAAKTALDGIREQWSLGDRTTREVLDAEQEFLTAEVSLIVAERDRIVASYLIAKVIGRLTLVDLNGISLASAKDTIFSSPAATIPLRHSKKKAKQGCCLGSGERFSEEWGLRLLSR